MSSKKGSERGKSNFEVGRKLPRRPRKYTLCYLRGIQVISYMWDCQYLKDTQGGQDMWIVVRMGTESPYTIQ